VDTHDVEEKVRHEVEDQVGRSLTDAEWEWLKQNAANAAPPPSKPPPGPRRSGAELVGGAIGWFLERLLLGGVFAAVGAGVAWAYRMDSFKKANDYGFFGWIGVSFLLGFLLLMNADDHRWAWGAAAVVGLLGLVAMLIGAIVRVS
jgi:hypothetical protein